MKKLTRLLILSGLISAPVAALAADSPHTVAGNIAFTTDYIFRGVSQSQHEPAIQGGFDYSHASGFYAGVWGSNVSWVSEGGYKDNNSMEIDLYGGYKGSIADGLGYDVGIVTYYYPGDQVAGFTDPDTTEVYLGVSWKTVSLKYSHVVSDYFVGWGGVGGLGVSANQKTRGSNYIDLSATYDLGGGWGVLGHVGHQVVENYDDASYTDWKIGVTKDIGYGILTLAYTDTDANLRDVSGNNVYIFGAPGEKVAEGQVALTFFKSF